MAKKSTQTNMKNEPDVLVVPKAAFSAKLQERNNLGKVIYEKPITNINELAENKRDYYKWDDYNSEYLKTAFNNENNEYKVRYDNVNRSFIISSPEDANEELKELKEDVQNKIDHLDKLLAKVDLLKSAVEPDSKPVQKEEIKVEADNTAIFIVHGHNNSILQTVARTVEKLGLKPIILSEQPNEGRTLIEKFETHSLVVGFAIILLTDDDEGKVRTEVELKNRARQNVILELGYFMGKMGRKRILPLYSEGVELPSDIHGLLYEPIDKSGNWTFAVVRELKAAGYEVDANKLL